MVVYDGRMEGIEQLFGIQSEEVFRGRPGNVPSGRHPEFPHDLGLCESASISSALFQAKFAIVWLCMSRAPFWIYLVVKSRNGSNSLNQDPEAYIPYYFVRLCEICTNVFYVDVEKRSLCNCISGDVYPFRLAND